MKPICVKCRKAMTCKKNEFHVKDEESGPGFATVWSGDMFECPICGAQVVVGFGEPMSVEVSEAYLDRAMDFNY